ncbi:hypothetical protein MTP99_018201 [Tenebrio molitor]|nr:hypothetical protein MTP99_018201 [Tenebrio molitor]
MINLKRKQTLSRHFRPKTISVWVRNPKHFRESAAHPVRVNIFRAFESQVRGRTGEKKEREPHENEQLAVYSVQIWLQDTQVLVRSRIDNPDKNSAGLAEQ